VRNNFKLVYFCWYQWSTDIFVPKRLGLYSTYYSTSNYYEESTDKLQSL